MGNSFSDNSTFSFSDGSDQPQKKNRDEKKIAQQELTVNIKFFNGKSIPIEASTNVIISKLITMIENEIHEKLMNPELVHNKQKLENKKTLAFYNIQNDDTIYLSFSMNK